MISVGGKDPEDNGINIFGVVYYNRDAYESRLMSLVLTSNIGKHKKMEHLPEIIQLKRMVS